MWSKGRLLTLKVLFLLIASVGASAIFAAEEKRVPLPGHVLPFLNQAKLLPSQKSDSTPITLTIVLKRTDQKGFDAYLRDVYDPTSPNYLNFLTPKEVSSRFGPSQRHYEELQSFFQDHGFTISGRSDNRITLNLEGTRQQAGRALDVQINDYSARGTNRSAISNNPALPEHLASSVLAVIGLNEGIPPAPLADAVLKAWKSIVDKVEELFPIIGQLQRAAAESGNVQRRVTGGRSSAGLTKPQTIGLTAFDRFRFTDLEDYLALTGGMQDQISNVSEIQIGTGAVLGEGQFEVVLDISLILTLAPDAQIRVYHSRLGLAGGFQSQFNAMINDGVDIISNSWGYCENQTSLADVESIEAILQTAKASGISMFSASGDTGSTCLNGSPDTVTVPASSPSATAVGGITPQYEQAFLYGTEEWWDGSTSTPTTGQGGFGTSRFFDRPSYQDGQTTEPMRSLPDVSILADPAKGVVLCIDDSGGCPTPLFYGGTSMGAPIWAALTAQLNTELGQNLGAANSLFYSLAGTNAFRSPATLGSDFAHVGLGTPNFSELLRLILTDNLGIPVANLSSAFATIPVEQSLSQANSIPADGISSGGVVVILRDASNYTVANKTIVLEPDPGSSVVVSPLSAVTNAANGAAFFEVTNLVPENVSFTVRNQTDGFVLDDQPTIQFVVPPAATAGISALSSTVPADGTTTTVTVTLRDALDRPTPGKLIKLSQSEGGRSSITSPIPAVTDANGEIEFTVSNLFNETVTYTAVDVTDGDLPVPGTAEIQFTDSDGLACKGPPPTAAPGYDLQPFVTGLLSGPLSFGGITFNGCSGATGMAFDDAGNFYVSSLVSGRIYKTDLQGGVADETTLLSDALGPAVTGLTFGADGKFYASRSGNVNQDVVEVDPVTGAIVRDDVGVVSLCAFGLATDPLSGDLFVGDFCNVGGSRDIFRIADPGGPAPVTSVYVSTPAPDFVNGQIAFAPDGTMYFRNGGGYLVQVAGTDQPSPDLTRIDLTNPNPFGNFGMTIGAVDENGAALSVIGNGAPDPDYGDDQAGMTAVYALGDNPTSVTTHLLNGQALVNLIGPNGCLYMAVWDSVYRLTNEDGTCPLRALDSGPSLAVTPNEASPNPTQGDEQTITARFINADPPEGTAVTFAINGANVDFRLARTDSSGAATTTYIGVNSGLDFVTATASFDGEQLDSNSARIMWDTGDSTSFLTLNGSTLSALEGRCTTVSASLADISEDPVLDIEGATINFALGGKTCSAVTNESGVATCSMRTVAAGTYELTATYAGSSEFRPASDARAFQLFEDLNNGVVFETGFGLCPDGR